MNNIKTEYNNLLFLYRSKLYDDVVDLHTKKIKIIIDNLLDLTDNLISTIKYYSTVGGIINTFNKYYDFIIFNNNINKYKTDLYIELIHYENTLLDVSNDKLKLIDEFNIKIYHEILNINFLETIKNFYLYNKNVKIEIKDEKFKIYYSKINCISINLYDMIDPNVVLTFIILIKNNNIIIASDDIIRNIIYLSLINIKFEV